MDNFIAVVLAVLPVMILIGSGLGLRLLRLLSNAGSAEMGKAVYWLALPCFLFTKLAAGDQASPPWIGLGIATLCYGASLALVLYSCRHLSPAIQGSLATMSYRANGAFVGLPIAILLIENGVCDPAFEQYFLILLAGTVPIFNVYSVFGFLLPHHGIDAKALRRIGFGLIKNPLIWSCFLGLWFSQMGWGQALEHNVLMRSFSLIGQAAIPMALIMAGASLRLESLRAGGKHFWIWAAWKMLLLPIIVFAICILLEVDQHTLMGLTILSASPSAVAAVPMSQELGGDEEISAASVVVTTMICPISLVAFILLAQA